MRQIILAALLCATPAIAAEPMPPLAGNIAIHDPSKGSREEYVRRSVRFGIRVEQPRVTVPAAEVVRITPLGEIEL